MKNFKKMSKESLKFITGGINTQTLGDWMCEPGKKQVRCVDPDTGTTSWQCTLHGDPRLCIRVIPV
ncbi:hypothetical protein GCM10022217_25260 [Chryseobacterium ginsenosidimutans]|uniref:bacteriocin-like protein n=1 Tax=Chryseobacterium ginsenosidimutans TaxID=687846 RepID=UPI0031D582E7